MALKELEARYATKRAKDYKLADGEGPQLLRHCRIDADVIARLEQAEPFAPLHVPAALALLATATARYPGRAQIACFDTVFHAGMPHIARMLPAGVHGRRGGPHEHAVSVMPGG